MQRHFAFLAGPVLLGLATLTFAAGGDDNPALTGTVNIVLANGNGMVVITDSNQTSHLPNGTRITGLGQKLFRLDDRTVCTIAGFAAVPLPAFPDFDSTVAGILDRYAEELRANVGPHSFREKLTSLRFLVEFQLAAIGNLQHLNQSQVGDYGFELTLAGYDTDGTPIIGKIVLSTTLDARGIFLPVVERTSLKRVGPDLEHETAGIGAGDVENIMKYPGYLPGEPEISRYAASMASDHGRSLTVSELMSLARSLAHHSAVDNRSTYLVEHESPLLDFRTYFPVGGPDQIAVFEGGSITKFEEPSFEARPLSGNRFGLVMGNILDYNGGSVAPVAVVNGNIGLFLKNHFLSASRVGLDGAYYFENDFKNSTLYYDGGVLAFDPSNQLTECVLELGPHANRTSPKVKDLIAQFPWKTVR